MSDQLDMFGGSSPIEEDTKTVWARPAQAADASRRVMETCWNDCTHCGPIPFERHSKNPKRRVFRVCNRPGRDPEPTYELDTICEHATVFDRPRTSRPRPPERPVGSGWDDF